MLQNPQRSPMQKGQIAVSDAFEVSWLGAPPRDKLHLRVLLPDLGTRASSFTTLLEQPVLMRTPFTALDLPGQGDASRPPANTSYFSIEHFGATLNHLLSDLAPDSLSIVSTGLGEAVALQLLRCGDWKLESFISFNGVITTPAESTGQLDHLQRSITEQYEQTGYTDREAAEISRIITQSLQQNETALTDVAKQQAKISYCIRSSRDQGTAPRSDNFSELIIIPATSSDLVVSAPALLAQNLSRITR